MLSLVRLLAPAAACWWPPWPAWPGCPIWWSISSRPRANPVMGLLKHLRPALADGTAAGQPVMPVKDPAMTLAQITAAARAHLPGAVLRRRLFATPCAGTSHR